MWWAEAHVRTKLWEPLAVGSQLKVSLSRGPYQNVPGLSYCP